MNDTLAPEKTAPFVRPDVQACLTALAAMDSPQLHELPVAEARQAFVTMGKLVDLPPRDLAVIRDLSFAGPAGDVALLYYDRREKRDEPGPAIIFFHGGGFVIGDLDSHNPFCTELAEALDLPVIAVDYRMGPEHPFPAAHEDCEAAARWLAASPTELGLNITGLVPVGDSAGGNLTIAITHALIDAPADVPVIAQMPIYPVVTLSADWDSAREFADGYLLTQDAMEWFFEAFKPDPQDSRVELLERDVSTLPPTVVCTAGLDPLRDQGREWAARLVRAGVNCSYYEARGNIHGFICIRQAIPSSAHDCNVMIGRLKGVLAGVLREQA